MKNRIIFSQVTGGEFRGRKIESPESEKTHPMGSRERLAIMNSLGPKIKGARVLDAYAGTGALGIEAISRGAETVIFVEKDHQVAKVLKKNLEELKIEKDRYDVFEASIEAYECDSETIDIAFFDPPYDKIDDFVNNFGKIFENFNGGISTIVISHPKEKSFELEELKDYRRVEKTFAGAGISIFTK